MTIKDTIKKQINQVLKKKFQVSGFEFTQHHFFDTPKSGAGFSVEYPREEKFGDYSSNIAMMLGKKLGKNPMEIGEEIVEVLKHLSTETLKHEDKFFKEVEVVKPGFINFYLSNSVLQKGLKEILKKKEKFGQLKPDQELKIQVEFISANPTGPLTLANGRGGFSGDVLANVLVLAGHQVEREYFVNDFGNQLKVLGHSILKDKEAQYSGNYIDELNKEIKDTKDPDEVGKKGAEIILEKYIKPGVAKMNIKFDHWFSERKLHESGSVDEIIEWLKGERLVYGKDSAWWFCSSKFGDEKDRVIIKSDGKKTYLAGDFAYHKNKFERGFDKVINIWGADHHGDVARLKAAVEVLGHKGKLEILLMQMMRLIENNKEVRMSKRKGVYVLLEELVDEVGLDVTRFFFLMHANSKTMDFDLKLAKEKSSKNPVYYIQYAHARICSIIKKAPACVPQGTMSGRQKTLKGFNSTERELIKELIKWPELIQEVARNYEVHKLAFYAIAIADKFHDFYEKCRVIENNQVIRSRLEMINATQQVLQNVLGCLGVEAPEKM